MGTTVTWQAFHTLGNINDASYIRIAVVHGSKVFGLQRPVQCNSKFPWYCFGYLVCLLQTDAQGTANITDRCPCLQCAKGDNQRNMIRSVLTNNIVQYFTTPPVTKVCINIRHADPLWIQEAFKQQVKIQRVNIGNMHQVSNNRTRSAATARSHRNRIRVAGIICMVPAVVDKIPHNQEIGRITHRFDDFQFIIQTLAYFRCFFQACLFRQFCQ